MLVLSRRIGESVAIGADIVVTVVGLSGNQVRIGIEAPRDVRVLRQEIFQAMQEENRLAANAAGATRRLEDVAQKLRSRNDQEPGD